MKTKFLDFLNEYINWSKEDRIRQIKLEETIRVYEDENLIVLIPKTLDSVCLYGKGTNWCFASDSERELVKNGTIKEDETIFGQYNDSDVIYIFIMKNENKKYTLQFENGNFVDQDGIDYYFPDFINKYPKLKEILTNNIKFGTYHKYPYPWIHLDL